MAEFIDQRKQIAQQQQQQAQPSSKEKSDLFKNVPDLIEEKKKDVEGNYNLVNKYIKGVTLGKVCLLKFEICSNLII
jgi:hypothetical protein